MARPDRPVIANWPERDELFAEPFASIPSRPPWFPPLTPFVIGACGLEPVLGWVGRATLAPEFSGVPDLLGLPEPLDLPG